MEGRIILVFILLAMTELSWSKSSPTIPENEDCVNAKFKCTANDTRKHFYRNCAMSAELALWCNYSDFKSIPNADTIFSYKSCRNARALYIEDSCLVEIKRDDMLQYPNITALTCGKNYITELPEKLFSGNKRLKFIDFCLNIIRTIAPDAFRGLSALQHLNLANNDISEIPETMFRGLVSLAELSLHNNKITLISDNAFQGLENVKQLRLTANRISHIKPKAFRGLETLTHLHLDENKLDSLEPGLFAGLKSLVVLTLSYNKLKEWPATSMEFSGIHTLHFDNNLITGFKSTDVANMSQLQNLSLENNSLTSLSEDLFRETPNLRYLNVAENYLDHIPANTFCNLQHLETLVLHSNNLKRPFASWFVTVIRNNIVHGTNISGNIWKCDCDVIKYESFVDDLKASEEKDPQRTKWSKVLQISCDSPKHLKGALDKKKKESIIKEETCHILTPSPPVACNATKPVASTTGPFTRIPTTYEYTPTADRKIETTESRLTTKQGLTSRRATTTIAISSAVPQPLENTKGIDLKTTFILLALAGVLLLVAIIVFVFARRAVYKKGKDEEVAREEMQLINNRSEVPYDTVHEPTEQTEQYNESDPSTTHLISTSSQESADSGYTEIVDGGSDSFTSESVEEGYTDMRSGTQQIPTVPKDFSTGSGGPIGCTLASQSGVAYLEPIAAARIEPDGLSMQGDASQTTEPKRLVGDDNMRATPTTAANKC